MPITHVADSLADIVRRPRLAEDSSASLSAAATTSAAVEALAARHVSTAAV